MYNDDAPFTEKYVLYVMMYERRLQCMQRKRRTLVRHLDRKQTHTYGDISLTFLLGIVAIEAEFLETGPIDTVLIA